MPQLTLVARYGHKSPDLSRYLESCGQIAASVLGDAFEPYDLRQIHATIVGLEHPGDSIRENACFHRLRGRSVEMDIPGFLDSLRKAPELPFRVQIGGFTETDRPFLSRNASPYLRSFSVQGDKAVVIGWPRRTNATGEAGEHPLTLDALRRRAQRFGILHAYHGSETELDNDFFFRIGLVRRDAVSDGAVRNFEQRIRRYMSNEPPLIQRVGLDDLHVALYEDERLPLDSTEIWPVLDSGLGTRLEVVLSP